MARSLDIEELNPGERLRDLLRSVFPKKFSSCDTVKLIDEGFTADGEIEDLVYASTLNYLVRRLITLAHFLMAKNSITDPMDDRLNKCIKRYLLGNTGISESHHAKIIYYLQRCLDVSDKKISPGVRNEALTQGQRSGGLCCLSGETLDYDLVGQEHSEATAKKQPDIEHKWPRSMGGSSFPPNIIVSSVFYNRKKSDRIDGSDYHYETICLKTDRESNKTSFESEFDSSKKLAVLAKQDYRCAVCGKTVSEVGPLSFSRKQVDDSWHFINIIALCGRHSSETEESS